MNYSKEVEDAIKKSKDLAIQTKSKTIRPEHLFLALIDKENVEGHKIVKDLNLNIDAITLTLMDWSSVLQSKIGFFKLKSNSVISLDSETENILKNSITVAESAKSDSVKSEHVMYSILENKNNLVNELFSKSPETFRMLKNKFRSYDFEEEEEDYDLYSDDYDDNATSNVTNSESTKKSNDKNKTPLISEFGTDLTKMARQGELDPVVGRKDEIKRISQILSRRKKNNPVLVGEPGVGKSAIVEGIAQLIVDGHVPDNLLDKKIITLDMGSLVAGTKYRGEFEQRMRGIIKEMNNNKDIILFIDEIHTIIGAGSSSGSLDAANMLKPALSRGNFRCIGATTLDEYRKHIEKDGALERRFQKIVVDPTTPEETIQILNNIKTKYEEHHKVVYTEDAILACVNLTDKYMSEKFLPDKAIDALDEAGSKVHNNKKSTIPEKIIELNIKIKKTTEEKEELVKEQKFEDAAKIRDIERKLTLEVEIEKEKWRSNQSKNIESVTKNDVAEVVALMTKIPVDSISTDENDKLKVLAPKIKNVVIGQDDAVDKLIRSVKRARIGIKLHNKPIGSFLFLGPTGVGKTYLAKVLAKELFGSEDSMIRIDMSEYMEKHTVSRLVGAPPGYVGYEDGGELTEAVRRKPYSIILLDEIEKAHPDVYNILLQLLDDGVLTDSFGRHVDFKNTIIIMTSNSGSRKLKDFGTGIGFNVGTNDKQKDKNSIIEKELKRTFSPEFLNRIDDIVMFNSLSKDDIYRIVDVEIKSLINRLKNIGYDINITNSLKEYLFEIGYDESNGARPLKRAIQKHIEDTITDAIINDEISIGDRLSLRYDKNNSNVKIVKIPLKNLENDLLTEQTSIN